MPFNFATGEYEEGAPSKRSSSTTKKPVSSGSFDFATGTYGAPQADSSVQAAVARVAPERKMPQLFGKDLVLTPESDTTLGTLKTSSKYLSSFAAGALDVLDTTLGTVGKLLTKPVERAVDKLTGRPIDKEEIDPADKIVEKMREYGGESFVNDLFGAAGSSAPFLLLGAAIGPLAAGASTTTKIGVGAAQSVPESFVEAKQTYDSIKEAGGSKGKAVKNAVGTFLSNEILNTASFLFGFGAEKTTKTKDFLKEYFSEIGQEDLQQVVQNIFTKKPILSGLAETTAISAIIAAPAGYANITSKNYDKSPAEDPSAFLKDLADKEATIDQVADFISKTTGVPIEQATQTLTQSLATDEKLSLQYQKNQDEKMAEDISTIASQMQEGQQEFGQVEPFLQKEAKADEAMFKTKEEKPLTEEAKKYKSDAEKQITEYKKEGIFLDEKDNPKLTMIPADKFNGTDIGASQNTVDIKGVKAWKKRIEAGERPSVLLNVGPFNKELPKVVDGHHRLEAYLDLGFKEIPVIDNTKGKLPDFKATSKESLQVEDKVDIKPLTEQFRQGSISKSQFAEELKKALPQKDGVVIETLADDAQGLKENDALTDEFIESRLSEDAVFKEEKETEGVSSQVGLDKIKSYQERLGIDFPVFLYEKIYTGGIRNGSPVQAFGMFLDNTITLAETITEFTADHEIGHFVFKNLENIPVFKGLTREQILADAKKKYGEMSDVKLEEKIMEDFEKFAQEMQANKKTSFTGKIKKFFQGLYDALGDLLNISKNDARAINKFYNTLFFGKGKGVISFENTGKTSAFMEARFKEFGEEVPSPTNVSQSEIENEYQNVLEEESIPTIQQMPEELVKQEALLRIMQDAIANNPAKGLEQFESKSGEFKGQLKEVTGTGKSTFGKSGDDIVTKFGYEDSEQAREAYREYKDQKEKFREFKSEYKKNLKEYRTSQRDAKALERILNKISKDTVKMIKENENRRASIERIFGKGFKAGEKAGIKIGEKVQKGKTDIEIEQIKRGNELQRLRENIIKRSYTNSALDMLRKDIPRKEWATYMTRLSNIGTSESKFVDLLEAISERKVELDIENQERKDESTVRSSIGFLKKIYDIEPSLILSIKQDLGIRDTYKSGERTGEEKEALKSIKDYNMLELLRFKEELQKRIQFRKDNPVHYFDYAKLKEETKLQKFGKGIKKIDQDVIAPIERKIKKISNPLYESLMTVFFQQDQNNKIDSNNVAPMVDVFNKATLEDQSLITQYAQSADETKLRAVLEKYATQDDVDAMLESARKTLDRIHDALNEVGVEVPYRKSFFPRKLKPLTVEQADLMIRNFEHKMGKKATQEEKIIIMNNLLRGFDTSRLPFITLSGKRFEAHRMLETIPLELLPLYEDFATALKDYIAAANSVIEQRTFFGKSLMETTDYDTNLENSIGAKVVELQESGVITMEQTQDIKDALQTLFSYKLSAKAQAVQQFTNDYIYPLTLGQILSTVNQAKDLTMQSLLDIFEGQFNLIGKQSLTTEDVNQSESIQELESSVKTSENKIAQFGKKIMTPFSKADNFFLTVFINSSYKRMVKLAKSNNPRFKKGLEDIFGKEDTARLIAELKTKTGNETAEELPEGVTRWLYSEVAKTRPITKLQKARGSIRSPAWYTLKNFAVKQLEFVRSQSLDIAAEGIKTKNKAMVAEGVGKFVAILSLMGLWGASVDELKDFILGKNKESFWDKMVNNMLQVIGLNSYMLNMAKQEGLGKQIVASYTPAVASVTYQLLDDIWSDLKDTIDGDPIWDAKVIKRVPLVGNIFYNRFGGGS